MEYAARLTRIPSRKTMVAPFVALVVGAGVATGAYALIDDGNTATSSKVIVVEQPGPNAADIPGKNEAATAAAISGPQVAGITEKNEAATAAAISQQSGGIELRGSKASSTGTQSSGSSSADRASELRNDPHAPARFLLTH
jgi:hypothetical protein